MWEGDSATISVLHCNQWGWLAKALANLHWGWSQLVSWAWGSAFPS